MTESSESLFCLSLPNLPIAWDSTMLGLLKECPRKFKYVIIDGLTTQGFAAHLEFGKAYHAALERYDHDKASGLDHEQSLLNATRFAMNYGVREEDGSFRAYDRDYTGEASKTRETLVQATIWYLENFRHDPCKTVILANGKPAVEFSFKVNLDLESPDGSPFVLCGHLDRLVEMDGLTYWLDRKTTKTQINHRFWKQFTGPHNQFSLYTVAGQLVLNRPLKGGIIDAVELGAGYARFARKPFTKTQGQLKEWLDDTYWWIEQASHMAAEDRWPMNDKSCSNYGGCPFLSICGRDPKVRQGFLEHEGFVRRQWNPLESR